MDLPDLKKVDASVVSRYCEQLGVDYDKQNIKRTIEDLAAVMTAAADVSQCTRCGGDSDSSLDECPYCGEGDGPAPEQSTQQQPKPEVNKPMARRSSKKAAGPKASAKKSATDKTPKATKRRAERGKKAAAAVSKALATASTAIVPASSVELAETTHVASRALQNGMDKVRGLQRAGIELTWELGNELAKLFDEKLFTQLQDEKGKPVYKDWSTFVKKEFGIVPAYSYKLMDTALHFTKKQVVEVGVTKLSLMLRIPENKRAELLEHAKETSRTELAKLVNKVAGGKKRDTGRGGFKGASGKGRGAHAKSDKLTVVRAKAKTTVLLYKEGSTVRATTSSNAVGIERCDNGVEVHYSLQKTDAGLSLVVEIKREADQAAAAAE